MKSITLCFAALLLAPLAALPQPETVSPGAVVKNLAAQRLTRIEFRVPVESLKRGPNTLAIAANRTGSFPASKPAIVEKVELHMK